MTKSDWPIPTVTGRSFLSEGLALVCSLIQQLRRSARPFRQVTLSDFVNNKTEKPHSRDFVDVLLHSKPSGGPLKDHANERSS